jgi:nitroreductase
MVLAAHNIGLGTCPIGLIHAFGDEIRELLNIPDEKNIVIGIALGYPDTDSPVNRIISERAPLVEVARFY